MTIKHKCEGKVVENHATTKTHAKKSYNEHAAMHYDGGGWSTSSVIKYTVDKCGECGKSHELNETEIL